MRILFAGVSLLALQSCATEGCLGGNDDSCIVPSPCEDLSFTCDNPGVATVAVLQAGDARPGGNDALAAPGDVMLSNGRVQAVIDALDHPHYLAPTGGSLLDLVVDGQDHDSLRSVFQVVGLLPEDGAKFTSMEILDDDPSIKAVQVRGELVGREGMTIATRYEIRPCEPGIRVRTELLHRGSEPVSLVLADGWYWGTRESLPFTPGAGFVHPSFGLSTVTSAYTEVPYMIAAAHADPAASYVTVACNLNGTHGFHSDNVSSAGTKPRVLMPGDYLVYERFIGVTNGGSAEPSAQLAHEIRAQLFGEETALITGQLSLPEGDPGSLGDPVRAQIIVERGTLDMPIKDREPWSYVVPDAQGIFRVQVPHNSDYVVRVESFGLTAAEAAVTVTDVAQAPVELTLPGAAAITIDATVDGNQDHVLAFVVPASDSTAAEVEGSWLGNFEACAPMLGNPHGPSPACNRVLVDGMETVLVPPGSYEIYASAGIFSTLARSEARVVAGDQVTATLNIQTLPVQPVDTMSGDFHVHGSASFDSSLDDYDRARSFLASKVQVIATTEHDTVADYEQALQDLGAAASLHLMPGTEVTGSVLFDLYDDAEFPKVIGHWNYWPLSVDPEGPWRGAPWDELAWPGQISDRMVESGWDPNTGIAQLNHPVGEAAFGRDYGWIDAIELDLNEGLPPEYDGSGQSMFHAKAEGSTFRNSDFDTTEVMNGSPNYVFEPYRDFWFYLLNQGEVRSGVANSDSHTLTEHVVGTPRTLVEYPANTPFDPATYNRAIKEGRMTGTNGPVLEVSVVDGADAFGPSLTPLSPSGSAELQIRVSAVPWVPLREVRILVNGEVVRTIEPDSDPSDPFGSNGLLRLDTSIPLSELWEGGDGWLIVEAGHPLPLNADLDCDGFVDTGDNNGDGQVNWRDVEELEEEPKDLDCLEETGPLAHLPPPERGTPLWTYQTVVTDGYPAAFTNPFLFDPDGNGYEGVAQ